MKNEEKLMLEINSLRKRIEKLEDSLNKYRHLAKTVQSAETLEFDIYEQELDDTWIAVSKDDYENMMKALAELDELEPWKMTLEKRLGRR